MSGSICRAVLANSLSPNQPGHPPPSGSLGPVLLGPWEIRSSFRIPLASLSGLDDLVTAGGRRKSKPHKDPGDAGSGTFLRLGR